MKEKKTIIGLEIKWTRVLFIRMKKVRLNKIKVEVEMKAMDVKKV